MLDERAFELIGEAIGTTVKERADELRTSLDQDRRRDLAQHEARVTELARSVVDTTLREAMAMAALELERFKREAAEERARLVEIFADERAQLTERIVELERRAVDVIGTLRDGRDADPVDLDALADTVTARLLPMIPDPSTPPRSLDELPALLDMLVESAVERIEPLLPKPIDTDLIVCQVEGRLLPALADTVTERLLPMIPDPSPPRHPLEEMPALLDTLLEMAVERVEPMLVELIPDPEPVDTDLIACQVEGRLLPKIPAPFDLDEIAACVAGRVRLVLPPSPPPPDIEEIVAQVTEKLAPLMPTSSPAAEPVDVEALIARLAPDVDSIVGQLRTEMREQLDEAGIQITAQVLEDVVKQLPPPDIEAIAAQVAPAEPDVEALVARLAPNVRTDARKQVQEMLDEAGVQLAAQVLEDVLEGLPAPEKGVDGVGIEQIVDGGGRFVCFELTDGRTFEVALPEGEPGKDGSFAPPVRWRGAGEHPRGAIVFKDGGTFWVGDDDHLVPVAVGIRAIALASSSLRNHALVVETSDGAEHSLEFKIAVPLHRGTWDVDLLYEIGDEVAWNGSTWRCTAAASQGREPPGDDWQLVAKQGKQGKPGLPGKGEDGIGIENIWADGRSLVVGLTNGDTRVVALPEPEE